MSNYDRLSGLDASFLHLESIETPMHVGAVAIFEGEPFFDENGRFRLSHLRDLVSSRLHLVPRFRKKIMNVPFAQGRPIWVDDERFDIAYHVRLTALPSPGSWEQLMDLACRVQSRQLDRSRPLWELWFVEGLEGGKVAFMQKTHHALVDGISGIDVATVLMDFSPEPSEVDPQAWEPTPNPDSLALLGDTLLQRITEPAEIIRTTRHLLRVPRDARDRAKDIGRSLASFVTGDLFTPARTSINGPIGQRRIFEVVRIQLEDAQRVHRILGGTVNDVILAGVAGGLHELLESRGEETGKRRMRAICPVSVRSDEDRGAMGNRIAGMVVPLNVGDVDAIERLHEIRLVTADLKDKRQAHGADFLVGLAEYVAPTTLVVAARVTHRQPFVNLIVTNMPGPQTPLYCMGARLLEAFPIVPLARNMTLGVAIMSYCGQLSIGLYGDKDSCPDLHVLATGIEDTIAELVKIAAGAEAAADISPEGS